jgi:hypothetical protein
MNEVIKSIGYTDFLKNEFLEQLIILALMKMIFIDI